MHEDADESPEDTHFEAALRAFDHRTNSKVFKEYWDKADAPPCKCGRAVYIIKQHENAYDEDYFGCKNCGTGNSGWTFWDTVIDKYHLSF